MYSNEGERIPMIEIVAGFLMLHVSGASPVYVKGSAITSLERVEFPDTVPYTAVVTSAKQQYSVLESVESILTGIEHSYRSAARR